MASVYPNPTTGKALLLFENFGSKEVIIEVYELASGKMVQRQNFAISANHQGYKLNLTDYSAGAYLVSIKDKTGRILVSRKVVKST